jgi:hypothetical protein
MTTCDACGFRYDPAEAPGVAAAALEHAKAYAEVLAGDPVQLRRRPAPDVWSPLEYACHVRDVLLAQRERVLAARRLDAPVAEPMGRDERVELDGYARWRPADVARQLQDAALMLAHTLDLLPPADWQRTLVYTWPERAERTLGWLAVHTLHELRHHLLDMRGSVSVDA